MKPVYETTMVEQPYTVCRPVTTCRQEVVEMRLLRAAVHHGARAGRRAKGPRAGRGVRLRAAAGSSAASTKKKVTATVAVQCPPRTVSQRVFVSRPVVRNVTETRYVRETMVRQVPVQTCRMVAEERVETIPVTTCQYVAEERVEPYEVRPARWWPRSASRRSPSPTCQYVAEERVEPYEVQTCEMVAEERVETIPVTTCQYVAEERVEPYEVQTCQMVAEERVETIPVTTCQYVAEQHVERVPVTTCRMVAETASRQVPVCVPEQVPVTVNRCVARVVPRTDRRAAVHDGPGRRPDVHGLQLIALRPGGMESGRSFNRRRCAGLPGAPPSCLRDRSTD